MRCGCRGRAAPPWWQLQAGVHCFGRVCACQSRSAARPARAPILVTWARGPPGRGHLSPELLLGLTLPLSRWVRLSLVLTQADGLLLGSLLGRWISGQASDSGWGHRALRRWQRRRQSSLPHLLSPGPQPCLPPPPGSSSQYSADSVHLSFSESGCQGPAGSLVQNQQAGPPGPGGVRLQPSSPNGFPQVCLPPDLPGVRIQPSCPVSSVALRRLPLGCRPLVSSPHPSPGRPPEPLHSGLPGTPMRSSGFCEMCGKTRGRQLSCG